MTTTQQAFITAEIAHWARERLGESHDSLAFRIKVAREKLVSWEKGDAYPTFRQAQQLAHALKIPFGYLFLSSPPKLDTPLPDLRTVPGQPSQPPSPAFLDLLNSVLLKQQWYREYLQEEGRETLGFVGRFNIRTSVHQVANDIRETLAVTDALRQDSVSWEDFLRKLIHNSESAGILVLRSGIVGSSTKRKLSTDEFRGFAISDDLAPLVFINVRDAKAAQIFTLAHELAHIWIGQSGISNHYMKRRSSEESNAVERFCNRVAAEVLVPREQFLARWHKAQTIQVNLTQLSSAFRVSTVVVLRQAYELDLISAQQYHYHFQREVEKWKKKEVAAEASGGDFYATLYTRNSPVLTEAVVESALEGRLLMRDAAYLLSVKVPTLEKISGKLLSKL